METELKTTSLCHFQILYIVSFANRRGLSSLILSITSFSHKGMIVFYPLGHCSLLNAMQILLSWLPRDYKDRISKALLILEVPLLV
jgi:hypothetical protein